MYRLESRGAISFLLAADFCVRFLVGFPILVSRWISVRVPNTLKWLKVPRWFSRARRAATRLLPSSRKRPSLRLCQPVTILARASGPRPRGQGVAALASQQEPTLEVTFEDRAMLKEDLPHYGAPSRTLFISAWTCRECSQKVRNGRCLGSNASNGRERSAKALSSSTSPTRDGHRDAMRKLWRVAISVRLVFACRPHQDLGGRFPILKAS